MKGTKRPYSRIDESGYFPAEWLRKAEKKRAEEKKAGKSKKSEGKLNG